MRALLLVLLANIIGFGVLLLNQKNLNILIILGALLFIITLSYALIAKLGLGDVFLFLIVSMLLSVGIIMQLRINYETGLKQTVWFAVGIFLFFISYLVYKKIKFLDRLPLFYLALSLLLFLATFIFGKTVNGSKNWIVISRLYFQPSELIRLIYIFMLASFFCLPCGENPRNRLERALCSKSERQLIIMGAVYLHIGCLVLSREWGISVLFFGIYFALLFVFGENLRLCLLNLALGAAGLAGGYFFMHHIRVRVAAWLNPFADIDKSGYQIAQSLFAIASGKFSGSGIMQGSPFYIPEVHSDFIFSAICEELGILGGTAVIMLYFILVYRGFKIALSVTNQFDKTVAFAISVMLGLQTFIIIGGVIKLIPLTGITLPFISYGGSSLATSFMALGILQAISGKKEEWSDEI